MTNQDAFHSRPCNIFINFVPRGKGVSLKLSIATCGSTEQKKYKATKMRQRTKRAGGGSQRYDHNQRFNGWFLTPSLSRVNFEIDQFRIWIYEGGFHSIITGKGFAESSF